ncbi:hypothetical protein CEP54_001253 [Fusarium duplospermum]|uniref:Uncharacterized protein n=1 Tax=Fusarium duplospermum TaxID=1325734 RepID=A0A428R1Z0_9HYPO|nr:hypothetical protein CEP54_001253 [Fusarium duplospermum]
MLSVPIVTRYEVDDNDFGDRKVENKQVEEKLGKDSTAGITATRATTPAASTTVTTTTTTATTFTIFTSDAAPTTTFGAYLGGSAPYTELSEKRCPVSDQGICLDFPSAPRRSLLFGLSSSEEPLLGKPCTIASRTETR